MTTTPTAPKVPEQVRTVAYYAALIVGALATGATTVAAAVAPDAAETVAAVAGAVSGVVATIAGGLGVVYRPTPSQAVARPDDA